MKADSTGDASELVLELTAPAPSEAFVLFRRQPDGTVREFPLRVRLLREEEDIAILREAQEYAKENRELSSEHRDIYKEAQACALVARVLCRPEKSKRPDGTEYYPQLFTSTAQLRASFGAYEISAILNAHEVTKAKYRCFEDFSEEQVDRWAERLGDQFTGPLWLGRLDSAHWPDLMWSLARRVLGLSAITGHPLSTSPDTSESSQIDSGDGTGGSTASPFVQSSDSQKLPDDHLISKEEADAIAKKLRETE